MDHVSYVGRSSVGEYLKTHWRWFLTLGIILTVLGLLALGFTFTATLLSVIALGILLFSAGIFQLIEGFQTRNWGGFFLHLIIGILYLVAGAYMFFYPGIGAVSLTLLLGIFYVVVGFFRIITSLFMRYRRWGWTFFSGIVALIVGIFIWSAWPAGGLWIIGLLIGVDLLFYGLSILFFAFSVRRIRTTMEVSK